MAKGDMKKNIEGAKETMDELLFATRDFTDEVKKSAKEVFGIGTSANQATKAFRDLGTNIQSMASSMDNIVDGTKTATDLAKDQNKYAKAQAKFQTEYSQALSKANVSQKDIAAVLAGTLSIDKLKAKNADLAYSSEGDLLTLFEEQAKINKENVGIMSQMADRAKNIQKGVGLAGSAFSSMGGILKKAGLGDLGDKMGLDKAVEEGRKLSAELTNGGVEAAGMGTKLKVAGKMAGTIGKNLLASFGPIALIGLIVKEMLGAFKEMDSETGALAQNMGISYQQANKLNKEFMKQSDEFKEMNIQFHQIVEAQSKLNEKFQTGGKFSSKIANDYAYIQERTGLSDKAMGFLVKKQIKGKKTMKDQLKILHKTVTKFGIQNKMVFNVNKVMEKITKASKSIHLFTKGNVAELAKTAMLAQKFGAEMSTIEGIGSSLLDFESSIAAELEAELLLGQDINLEKARGFALAGDTAKLTEELLNQKAIMKAFDDGNVLSQEAAAKAIGLTRDQLAEIVMSQQEQAALQSTFGEGITDVTGAYNQYKEDLSEINAQIAAATTESEKQSLLEEKKRQEQEIFNELGNKNLENQLKSLSAEALIKKEKEEARDIAKKQALDMLGMVGSMENMVKQAKELAAIIAGIVIAWKSYQLISAAVLTIQAAIATSKGVANTATTAGMAAEGTKAAIMTTQAGAAVATASAATLGLGAIAIIAGIAGVMGYLAYTAMSDGVIGPGGEMMVSGPKGSIQLDKNDSIIAGTNLGGEGKRGDNRIKALLHEQNSILNQILNKSVVIEMGGNEVGQGINTAEREIQ